MTCRHRAGCWKSTSHTITARRRRKSTLQAPSLPRRQQENGSAHHMQYPCQRPLPPYSTAPRSQGPAGTSPRRRRRCQPTCLRARPHGCALCAACTDARLTGSHGHSKRPPSMRSVAQRLGAGCRRWRRGSAAGGLPRRSGRPCAAHGTARSNRTPAGYLIHTPAHASEPHEASIAPDK